MSTKTARSLSVVLKLSSKTLSQFPQETASTPSPSQTSKPASTPERSPAPQAVDSTAADTPADSTAAMNDASTPSSLAPLPAGSSHKRKSLPASKAGTKRSAAAVDGTSGPNTPKSRPKSAPKRRKIGDMINDPNTKSPFAAATPASKLGPKANQGAINAGLRALDRTGKFKCRKWEKKGFKLRSFTGVVWDVPSWKAPSRSATFSEDVKSDSTGSSDPKVKDESSAVSDKSGLNGHGTTPVPMAMDGLASSPAPVPATS